MQKIKLLSFIAVCMFSFTIAQNKNNIVFYSENGEKFWVVLNGIKQNGTAETNVKVTDLNQPTYKAKVIFEDKTLMDVDQNIYFVTQDGSGSQANATEFTYAVTKNKKGEYKIKGRSMAPIASLPPPPPEQKVIVYTTTPPAEVITTTTSTTTTNTGDNVNVGMGMPGLNMNVNINTGMGTGVQQTTTQTTTTTSGSSSSSGYSSNTNVSNNNNNSGYAEEKIVYLPGYNGPIGCARPMTGKDFEGVKSSISSKSFDDTKLTMAKQVIGANCLLSTQVKEIMLLFSFEGTRLDLAKFSYDKTYDQGNYYKLNDAFTFESSISELNDYINGKK